jgi:hypothetical protein
MRQFSELASRQNKYISTTYFPLGNRCNNVLLGVMEMSVLGTAHAFVMFTTFRPVIPETQPEQKCSQAVSNGCTDHTKFGIITTAKLE